GGNSDIFEMLEPVVSWLLRKQLLKDRNQFDLVLEPAVVCHVPRIFRKIWATKHLAAPRKLRVISYDQHDLAIRARERAGRSAAAPPIPAARGRFAVDQIPLRVVRQRRDHRIEEAYVNMLTDAARRFLMIQRCKNADRGIHASHHIDDARAD